MYCRFFLLLLTISFFSCTEKAPKAKQGTWFGGHIVNPIGNSVIFRKGNDILAEMELNSENRFLLDIPNFTPGLYEFLHKERQLVYLTAGDSVTLRVNTLEFDESITFSGFGSAKNNLMIDLFLMNEKENAQMASNAVYQESPETFETYLDSLQRIRNKRWEDFQDSYDAGEGFSEIAHAIINYDIYARKEVYPLTNFVSSKMNLLHSMPKEFYDYRKNVSFNQEEFLPLYSYQRFLFNYFNQASFKKYGQDFPFDPQSLIHNTIEIKLIDSLVSNKAIKNFLMTRNIRNYLSNSNDKAGNKEMYDQYMTFVQSESDRKNITELYLSNQNLESEKQIPNETLLNTDFEEVELRTLIKKPTIIYFWSSESRNHMIRAHAKAEKLRELYPQYDILDLNLDIDPEQWLEIIENQNFDESYSYRFVDAIDQLRRDFSINNIVKTLVLDKNGVILNAHANMFSSRFESEILGYLNKNDK